MDLTKLFKSIEDEGKIQLSEDFRKTVENTFLAAVADKDVEIGDLKKSAEALTTENTELKGQIETLKEGTLEEVKKETETFKEQLVEKISSYLEVELEKMVPQDIAEKVAKAEIYEPIVEGFKASVSRYGIILESEGMALLKSAKGEIEKLRGDVDTLTAANIELKTENAKNAEEIDEL